jgi:hypothetical protein
MQNSFLRLIGIGAAALALSPNLAAQVVTQVQLLEKNGPGGPAQRHDVFGQWAASRGGGRGLEAPVLTPAGLARFKLNKPGTYSAVSNDPWLLCDPFGFPRNLLQESNGIAFSQMPDAIVMTGQYNRTGRFVWMDGRELPKKFDVKDAPKSRLYGYSVGHWEGDNTLVINTNGVVDSTWLDQPGHPHSADMRTEERYTRTSLNVLQASVTVDDPKYYTKPFLLGKNLYRLIPTKEPAFGTTGEFDEQFCVPSEMLEYNKTITNASDVEYSGNKKK